ncbi:Mu transposase domain-containing protein [Streptomyces chartreusis]
MFETGRWFTPRVNRFGQITVRSNAYSVPVRFIGRQLRVLLHVNDLVVPPGPGPRPRSPAPQARGLPGVDAAGTGPLSQPLHPGPRQVVGRRPRRARRGRRHPRTDRGAAAGEAHGTRTRRRRAGCRPPGRRPDRGRRCSRSPQGRRRRDRRGTGTGPLRTAPRGATATVTFLSDRKLSRLPPDTKPLPSVAHYDQLLHRHGRTAGCEKEGS